MNGYPNNHCDLCWHSVDDGDLPEIDKYVLLHFTNFTLPIIGRYYGNDDDGFAFYDGDDDLPLVKVGLFVDAWMPLPESVTG